MSLPLVKLAPKRLLRLLLLSALVVLFILQCRQSYGKFRLGRIGVEASLGAAANLTPPDLTMCAGPVLHANDSSHLSLTEFYNQLKERASGVFVAVVDMTVSHTSNMLDRDAVSSLGLDWDSLWEESVKYIDANRQMQYCRVYKPTVKRGLGLANRLKVHLNTDEVKVFLHLHSGGRIYPSSARAFSSQVISPSLQQSDVEPKGNDSRLLTLAVYQMALARKKFLSKEKRPCRDENFDLVSDCFQRQFSYELGCPLPWANGVSKTEVDKCDRPGLMEETFRLFGEYDAMNDEEFMRRTGCVPSCEALLYSAKQANLLSYAVSHDSPSNVKVSLFFSQPEVESEEEYVVFDGFALAAEVGGYMGLLLGYSILSVADAALERGAGSLGALWRTKGGRKEEEGPVPSEGET